MSKYMHTREREKPKTQKRENADFIVSFIKKATESDQKFD